MLYASLLRFFPLLFGCLFLQLNIMSMPGDINTEPTAKLVFNAPYSEKHRYNFRLTNLGAKRIGWAVKTTNMKRISIDPPCGCLDAKEGVSSLVVVLGTVYTCITGRVLFVGSADHRHRALRLRQREHHQRPLHRGVDGRPRGSCQEVPARVVPERRHRPPEEHPPGVQLLDI